MRLYMLNAWRESPLYTPRERAALAWTEALTRITETGAPDTDYELLNAEFTEAEQVQLTMQISSINFWNRLQVGFRASHPTEERSEAA
jgi:alkylhydroperoxidase family enzyme